MWEQFYNFLKFLDEKIQRYPETKHFTIEMELDLYKFSREIGFMPENGIFKFKDVTFVLA